MEDSVVLRNTPGAGDAGTLLLPLRLVLGWTYFSAFWRRLILENKFRPHEPGYVGEKFNSFLPHALLVKPVLAYLIAHPELLWWKLLAFTIVEAVVGMGLILGFCTRLMGLVTSLLALGILLSAGWLGSTCVDEWQIGSLGVAAGLALFMAGGGMYSCDGLMSSLARDSHSPPKRLWYLRWPVALHSMPAAGFVRASFALGLIALLITLATNQAFHGGVWGKLHNLSVRPKVVLADAEIHGDALRFSAARIDGPDVYGSFAVAVALRDGDGNLMVSWSGDQLAALPAASIQNERIAHIETGPHGLILPLGAKAAVTLNNPILSTLPLPAYTLEIADVSGPVWTTPAYVLH